MENYVTWSVLTSTLVPINVKFKSPNALQFTMMTSSFLMLFQFIREKTHFSHTQCCLHAVADIEGSDEFVSKVDQLSRYFL